ncbi:MAG: hypothetical protein ACYDFU_03810 [Nitrospirota bacterium]
MKEKLKKYIVPFLLGCFVILFGIFCWFTIQTMLDFQQFKTQVSQTINQNQNNINMIVRYLNAHPIK